MSSAEGGKGGPDGLLAQAARLLLSEADRTTRVRLAAAMALVILGALLAAAAPLALKALVDGLAAPDAAGGVPATVLLLGGLYVLTLGAVRLLAELRPLLSAGAEQTLAARLSCRFVAHALALPLAAHRETHSGALAQTLRQATTGCQMLLSSLLNSITPVVVELVAVLVVLVHIDQPALVICFAVTAAVYLGLCVSGALRLQARARAVSVAGHHSQAVLADSLGAIESLKTCGAESRTLARFGDAAFQLRDAWLNLYRQRARTGTALALTFTASMAVSLTVAAQAYGQGTLSIGGFVLVTVYLLQLMRPLEMLGGAARDLAQALEFLRPLLTLLQQPVEQGLHDTPAKTGDNGPGDLAQLAAGASAKGDLPATDAVLGPSAPTIEMRGVRLAYARGKQALRDLNLRIPGGRTVALVGASGSGKTSIARLLMRLVEPCAGQILVDGQPVNALPLGALRSGVSLVPQDITLLDASIADNIGLADPTATRSAIEEAAQAAQLHDFVRSLPRGYDTRVGERGLMLSGGERQRIAIARLLLRPGRICIVDEATSMLDTRTEAAVLAALARVCRGSTTLLIAHRLSNLRWADEIAVLDQGQVVEQGTHSSLLARGGVYASLWRSQEHPSSQDGTPGHAAAHAPAVTSDAG